MNRMQYPKFTIIMRGYTFQEADTILQALEGFEDQFAVEVTLNTNGALSQIEKLNRSYGSRILIGAGTVRTLKDAQNAYEAGARFLLAPHRLTKEVIDFAKAKGLIVVPAAMTPSEINEMFEYGADIVKIFPANAVSPKFFKDVQAPLGQLPLMAVGGINERNVQAFFDNGASFVGVGSGMFDSTDIKSCSILGLRKSIARFIQKVSEEAAQ
ncbi:MULTISPECIES: bifunctional 4-hydroxy-2-oxoglutarate aldolase/2-dehydro-3-deoxy-phosphogluconate aldolase [unclassified Enterococcus]|uniref:bifunctional 4-hydroxy-2-oxoglutarate aldolase/2-dehydro-3-deoxy-phosphogluconate aldolase n=1 Tax=unclassified Enterococcus TaxID=2608891 RepID=UPI001555F256|nr:MULTISPECIES: bifunctional 4-hydroxy-2-oxoglutarate aldolase/2-dehydro-3-deoxy-phosphogluconate aldolase [unclassified Enterococcus]MBS7578020.1 bifunctional 4-hydroxy-2-oxoglutarate aldolase/2-dehydro-3-deoxy-phosphogluconate aldolase [Enterococcus sp. MMGLQ5-2]MBS7585290.1 bifunctional 4-hydroxy-2-oxoglutarate aldolase/2-dehydro-3-deoxy-phosphogluconate aldolase [Enterococcus sp. MMGLQ5-1]NPD13147.1 bifunctional 4-hydroxy-2-oxoglutarate aldolase/2-dehydro-3-deoxy-phosphogluconate aldolase [